MPQYEVGIYARLSVDKRGRRNESIDNQIAVAKEFISRNPEMRLAGCYTDCGRSGMTMERSGFIRLMQDVRKKKIDCIIVKDLSRLGRNYIETGHYLEQIFPMMGIRFIAVTDGYDSANPECCHRMFSVRLKNLVNEMYARDIGNKVRSAKRSLWEQGDYTGGTPPYGYTAERIDGQRMLVIHPQAAEVVRMLYSWMLDGISRKEMISRLYRQGVNRPSDYRRTNHVYAFEQESLQKWQTSTIHSILRNPVYHGCLMHRDGSINRQTHEAIVSEAVFYRVAERLENLQYCCNGRSYARNHPVTEDVMAGLFFCGHCKRRMRKLALTAWDKYQTWGRNYIYVCPDEGGEAVSDSQMSGILLTVLLRILREVIARMCKEQEGKKESVLHNQPKGSNLLERKIEDTNKRTGEAYFAYQSGRMTEQAFRKIQTENRQKIEAWREQIKAQTSKCEYENDTITGHSHAAEHIEEISEQNAAEWLPVFMKRIELYPNRRIKVVLAFDR